MKVPSYWESGCSVDSALALLQSAPKAIIRSVALTAGRLTPLTLCMFSCHCHDLCQLSSWRYRASRVWVHEQISREERKSGSDLEPPSGTNVFIDRYQNRNIFVLPSGNFERVFEFKNHICISNEASITNNINSGSLGKRACSDISAKWYYVASCMFCDIVFVHFVPVKFAATSVQLESSVYE